MTTLPVLLHVAAQRDHELHSLDFSTAFLQGSLHEEIWLRRPPGFTGSFPPGTQWSLRRPIYGLRQAPREWHDTLRTTLAALGFAPSTADPSLFLRTDTSLPPFYILVYITRDRAQRTITLTQSHMVQQVLQRFDFTYSSPQATPLSTFATSWTTCTSGLGLVLGGRRPVVLTGHADASWAGDQATQRSSQGYTFSLGSGSVSWRSTRSSSVLGSSCKAEIYAGAMAAQELRWLTYLLTDLGEPPRSPPVLYVDNKAMLALCREHRLEHRTKHIALRYFLARELQQRGQLRLAYVASEANTADIFTKALPPGDHQRFCTMLACFALLDWSSAAPGAAATAAAAPGAAATAAAAPRAATTAAAAPGAAGSGAVAPTTAAPGAATPAAGAELSLYSGSGLAVAAVVRLPFSPLMQLQRRPRESLTPQQLRAWYASWGCPGGRSGSRPGVSSSAAACSGQVQLQHRPRAVLSPQRLREWYAQRDGSQGTARCPYVIRTGARTGQPCGTLGHAESRCFARLSDAWRTEFGDAAELPDRVELLRLRVDIYTLDYDAILTAMYALPTSDEGDCYLCVPPDPGIEAAALGAGETAALGASASASPGTGESALSGTTSSQALHTFTLDSGASRSFFRDRTMLTPLSRPVAVSLADPSGGPVLASFSTVLPCPAAPSGTLLGLYLPSFSTNLVGGADLQDQGVDQFTPASQRVTHCTCARTGRHLATFTRRLGSSLYTLSTESPPVTASGQVAASSQVFAAASRSVPEFPPCSCHLLSHQTLLWHHRLGHPSLPRLQGMASRVLVSGLPRSLPPLPPGPAPTCVPCVEGRQRAAPHSSEFPPTEAPLQTLHMDVWGPARVRGQGHERYFLFVVDDYSRYTTVFPLRSKGDVTEVLIDWIRAARLQLRESFGSDFPVLRLHSDRGGEFSSARLGAFCWAQGIRLTFTLTASPQQNGIAKRRIGMVMDVARTSMIHVAAPHFLWPFAVQYAAHQLNLQPRVSLPETSPTLRWTGKVGDASAFRVWLRQSHFQSAYGTRVVFRGSARLLLRGGDRLTVKRPPGSPPVFKARYVARGFSQRQGVDYFQTFSPTPKMTTLRWSLRRPVYGLRQAPREWHDTLRTTLAALGFAPSTADPSLFLRTDTSLPPFYILVYVDDLVFATPDTAGLAHVKSELQKRHTCTDLGELRSYLGLQITRDRAQRTITLTQSHMVQQVLQRFDFTYSSPQATPLSTRHSLSALPWDESVEPSGPYPKLVGCLMCLMTCTQPDLAYPLSILARYVAPGRHRPEHMTAAKRVLCYLCSTSGMGLVLGGRRRVVLTGHADASWADDQATQRSSQGYTFSLGSGSISWRSTHSSSVLSSSCEAEIYAGAMAAQELRWLTYLLTDLGEPPRSPPVLYVDNKAMLALCREHRLEHRTKHIALRYFLARELQQRGQMRLAYVASEANTADIFTKALPPGYHQRFCTMLACFALLDWSCDLLFSPTLPMGVCQTHLI
ncbi:unnamed protein product [Closterium sp. NIES-53]